MYCRHESLSNHRDIDNNRSPKKFYLTMLDKYYLNRYNGLTSTSIVTSKYSVSISDRTDRFRIARSKTNSTRLTLSYLFLNVSSLYLLQSLVIIIGRSISIVYIWDIDYFSLRLKSFEKKKKISN